MKQNIKNNINRMRENKNKSRDEFNEIATSIAKGNKQQLEDNKEIIKKIIDEYKIFGEKYIQNIKDSFKNNKYNNSNELSLEEIKSSLTTYIRQENNYAYDVLVESDMNIIFKIAASPFALIGGLIGHFQDHSEEHEKFIKEYENNVNESLSIYEEKIEKNLKQIENYYCEQVKDIFDINIEYLQKIEGNYIVLKNVEEEFENFLLSKIQWI